MKIDDWEARNMERTAPYQHEEHLLKRLRNPDDNGRRLWLTTLVLWVVLVLVLVGIAESSRRFAFYGNSLRVVEHSRGNSMTLVDRDGNNMHITHTNGLLTAEYLGVSFNRHDARTTYLQINVSGTEQFPTGLHVRRQAELLFFAQVSNTFWGGLTPWGLVASFGILGFLLFLLDVASILYPQRIDAFFHSFRRDDYGDEPTEREIIIYQACGIIGIMLVYGTVIMLI